MEQLIASTLAEVAVGGSLVVVGVATLWRGLVGLRAAAVVARATAVTVEGIAMGSDPAERTAKPGERVAVQGVARPRIAERADVPVADRRPLLARTVRERYETSRIPFRSTRRWRPVEWSFDWVPFAIDDGTGSVEIEPPADLAAFGGPGQFERAIALPEETVHNADGGVARASPASDEGSAERRRARSDGGGERYSLATVDQGDELFVVATVEERFGNVYLTGQSDPASFRLMAGDRPSAKLSLLWATLTIAVGLAALAGGAVLIAGALL